MSSDISTFGSRLKEERERLGLSQSKLAETAGASKHSQIDWEAGRASPNARYLASIAEAGADVLYIISGERKSTQLGPLNPALLRKAIELVEEELKARRIRLSATKKAEVFCALYEDLAATEDVQRTAVSRALKLVA